MVTDADRFMVANIIKDAWSKSYFDITAIDKCLKILELRPSPIYAAMSKYHCVDFSKMPPDYPDKLLGMTLQELTRMPLDQLIDSAFIKGARANAEQLVENTLKAVQ